MGDILVTAESADILVLDTVADFLLQSWDSAGRTRLHLQEVERSCIHIPQASMEEVRDTVSSLRLDAVIASGPAPCPGERRRSWCPPAGCR